MYSCDISAWMHLSYKYNLIWKDDSLGLPSYFWEGMFFVQLKETKPGKALRQWKGHLHLLDAQGTLSAHAKTDEHEQPTGADTTVVSSFLVWSTAFSAPMPS